MKHGLVFQNIVIKYCGFNVGVTPIDTKVDGHQVKCFY